MRRLLIAIMGGLLLATSVSAQTDLPLNFEVRGTFTPSADPAKSFDFRPTIGLVTDGLWNRFDLGLAYTGKGLTQVDTSSSLEAGILYRVAHWASADGKRSFTLQGGVGADIVQSNMTGRRVYALGGILDAGLISQMKGGVRIAWVNQDDYLDDWAIQTFLQFDMD